jgi:hypothetical protein
LSDTPADIEETDAEVMARYGIKCVPTDRFHYKSFRFSNLESALIQARRDAAGRRS